MNSRTHPRQQPVRPAAAVVEQLEGRRLLSASLVSLHGGTLMVRGSSQGANEIRVYRDPATNAVSVSVYTESARTAAVRSFAQTYDLAEISRVIVKGGRFADLIQIGADDDAWTVPSFVNGGGGLDAIYTGGGADHIHGGDGDDVIEAGGGANLVFGHKGKDTIFTGAGDDMILGGDGDDTINAGDGANWVFAGKGKDNVVTGAGVDRVHGGHDDDQLNTGGGADLVRAGKGDDAVDAGDGDDTVHGQLGNDLVHGDAGNYVLWGGRGDDQLFGDDGDDQLGGILGVNVLVGGAGADRFLIRDLASAVDLDADASAGDVVSMVKAKADGDDASSL